MIGGGGNLPSKNSVFAVPGAKMNSIIANLNVRFKLLLIGSISFVGCLAVLLLSLLFLEQNLIIVLMKGE